MNIIYRTGEEKLPSSGLSDEELKTELAFIIAQKKKLLRKVDDMDTEIIGIKEILRRRNEKNK